MSSADKNSQRSLFLAVVDIAAYFLTSCSLVWLVWKIGNILDEQSDFSVIALVALFLSFLTAYSAVIFRFGNTKSWAILCLGLTSIFASSIYTIGTVTVILLFHPIGALKTISVGQLLLLFGFMSIFSLIISICFRFAVLILYRVWQHLARAHRFE